MLVSNISEISAVARQIRATAGGNEMIIVRGIRRSFQDTCMKRVAVTK